MQNPGIHAPLASFIFPTTFEGILVKLLGLWKFRSLLSDFRSKAIHQAYVIF